MRPAALLGILTALGTGMPLTIGAQVFQPWGDPAPRAVSVDIFRPAFDGGGTSTFTTINQVGVRWATGRMVLVAELPIVIAKADGAPSGGTLIGNPYLGVSTAPTSTWIGELGIRLPVASASTPEKNFAELVGVIGDLADFEAYAEDVLAIRLTAGSRHRAANGTVVRAALRPTLMAPTGNNSGDSELFIDYAFHYGYESDRFTVGGMFNGRAIVTEGGSFGERTFHELGLGGSLIAGQWRPGLILRLPLDKDLSDSLQPSLGVKLEVTF